MDSENKKISFGFSKSSKKPIIFGKSLDKQKKVELIDCLEAQTIKIKDAQESVKGPLIIPMLKSSFNILDRRREIKPITEDNIVEKPDSELTVDELAARELIREAQNTNTTQNTSKVFVLPTVTENTLKIEGKEESTLDDYESVPISDYGMAMLRGMGWNEGSGIGKNNKKIKMVEPPLRPKGMGLGASLAYNDKKVKPAVDKSGKELMLCKGSYAKIIDGKKKGCYCEVQGFDDEAGRIIVKTSLDGLILSLNEFLVAPVTKEEYDKSSKVINIVKYEEYKNKVGSADSIKREEKVSNSGEDDKQRDYTSNSSSRHKHKKKSKKHRNSSSSSDEREHIKRRNKKERRRSSSSDYGYEKHKKKSYKNKNDRNSSSSESDHKYNYKKEKKSSHKHVYSRR